MLPAAARLRRRADFVATVRGGRRRGHGAVVVHLSLPDTTEPADAPARVGFVVSRAVGGAVVRNRVRRRLQHLVHDRYQQIPAGAALVVRALPAAAGRDYSALSDDLDAALRGALAGGSRGKGGRRGAGGTPHQTPGRPPAGQPVPSPVAERRPRPSLLARALTLPIVAYRRWVSPALPARCRFYPSCSAYALEALAVHGAVRGVLLSIWRLLRCHPFHPGGYDPVPPAPRRRLRAFFTGASTCSTG